CQSPEVAVLGGSSGRFAGCDLLFQILLAGFDQSPDNVSVGRAERSTSEAIESLRVQVEPAVSIAPRTQPRTGSIEHVLVDGAHTRHIGELQQTVCGKG